MQDYDTFLEQIKVYEYAIEIYPEPLLYEIPVDIKSLV